MVHISQFPPDKTHRLTVKQHLQTLAASTHTTSDPSMFPQSGQQYTDQCSAAAVVVVFVWFGSLTAN